MYHETRFSDTGLYAHYKEETGDDTNRIVSIAESWTRKVLSSVRASSVIWPSTCTRHGQPGSTLPPTHEHSVCKLPPTSWLAIPSLFLAILGDRTRCFGGFGAYHVNVCYGEEKYPRLYDHVRGLRGEVRLCAFPNLFITIAPAEWTFPRPYFLQPYLRCVFAGAYVNLPTSRQYPSSILTTTRWLYSLYTTRRIFEPVFDSLSESVNRHPHIRWRSLSRSTVCPYVCMSACPHVCMSVLPYVRIPVCLYVFMPVCHPDTSRHIVPHLARSRPSHTSFIILLIIHIITSFPVLSATSPSG